MNKKIGALLVAVGMIASACGGSSESRTRNAVIERKVACFATQEDKSDTENAMLQRKAEFEGLDQGQMVNQFNLLRVRVDEVYARQLAHPEWNSRITGPLSDQGRKELQELSDDYSAILEEYEALRQAIWYTNIEDGPAYFETKYQTAVATPVCDGATNNSTDESSTSSLADAATPDDQSQLPVTESSNDVTENTMSAIDNANTSSDEMKCPRPVVQSHNDVHLLVNQEHSFYVSKCKQFQTEIFVKIVEGSATYDDVQSSLSGDKDIWGVVFLKPGRFEVRMRFLNGATPISQFSNRITINVSPADAADPCAGATPILKLNEEKTALTVTSTCPESERIDVKVYSRNGKSVSELHYGTQYGSGETHDPYFSMMLSPGQYRLQAHHLITVGALLGYSAGKTASLDVDWMTEADQPGSDEKPIVAIMPVAFFEETDEPVDDSAPSDAPVSQPAFAVSETVEAMKCDEACVAALAKKTEIPASDVKTIEASVFEGIWFPLLANNDIPLTGSLTTLNIRVTPASGDPVTIGASIHKGSVGASEPSSTNNKSGRVVYADSENPSTTFTVAAASSSSFISTNWWWIALLIVLTLAVLAYGVRKRAAQLGR